MIPSESRSMPSTTFAITFLLWMLPACISSKCLKRETIAARVPENLLPATSKRLLLVLKGFLVFTMRPDSSEGYSVSDRLDLIDH